MSTKVAINGFGRIGRLALRAMLERHKQELTVVAVNDIADLQTNAHLFRYDSTYGIFPGQVETGEGVLKIDGWEIMVLNQKDPSRLPWRALGVDIVIESTGVFTDGDHVRAHLEAGAKKVIHAMLPIDPSSTANVRTPLEAFFIVYPLHCVSYHNRGAERDRRFFLRSKTTSIRIKGLKHLR